MRVLVTGAEGFIGKNVMERMNGMPLSEGLKNTGYGTGIELIGTDCVPGSQVFADLSTKFCYDPEQRIDGVIHLAAKSGVRSFTNGDYDNNVQATKNLLEWLDAKDIKFLIYASSSSVYGNAKLMDETTIPNPQSPYAESKLECEKLVKDWSKKTGGRAVVFRIFNAIGKYQRTNMLPSLIASHMYDTAYTGDLVDPLSIFGNRLRSWTYVGDIVNALWSALDTFFCSRAGTHLVVNLGSVATLSQSQLIDAMKARSKVKHVSVEHCPPHPLDLQRTKPDMTRFESLFGWSPNPRNLEVGIDEVLSKYELLDIQK